MTMSEAGMVAASPFVVGPKIRNHALYQTSLTHQEGRMGEWEYNLKTADSGANRQKLMREVDRQNSYFTSFATEISVSDRLSEEILAASADFVACITEQYLS